MAGCVTRSALLKSTRASSSDLSQPRVLRLLRDHAGSVLALAASRAERAAVRRQLRVLWLGAPMVAGAAVGDDDDRLLVGATNAGSREPGSGSRSAAKTLAVVERHYE